MQDFDSDAPSDNESDFKRSFISASSIPSKMAAGASKPSAAQEESKNAAAGSGTAQKVKVFLMTTGDRYQQYFMEAIGPTIYFYRLRKEDKGTITQNLTNTHITSIDSQEKKVLCKSRRHFGFTLSNEQGHRKLYFMTWQLMLAGVEYVLKAQNFASRTQQYTFTRQLPDNQVCDRWLAKHMLTGETFMIKRAPREPANDPVRELAMNEIRVLQLCSKSKLVVELEDYFEEEDSIYTVHQHVSKSLRDYVTKSGRSVEPIAEEEAVLYIHQLARTLEKLHGKYIVHRDLWMDAVKVKVKKSRIYLLIGQFDFSLQLKKNHTVQQSFNVMRPLAPEILAGQPHDMAVDIWALGQIAYQLLCCPSQQQILEIPEEVK